MVTLVQPLTMGNVATSRVTWLTGLAAGGPQWRSFSYSKLAWRLQVKNRNSCLWSARMRRWSPPSTRSKDVQGGQATGTTPVSQVTHEVAALPVVRSRTSVTYLIPPKEMGVAGTMCLVSLLTTRLCNILCVLLLAGNSCVAACGSSMFC